MERYQLIELIDEFEKVCHKESELKVPTREQVEKAWETHWESVDSGRIARCANCGFEAIYPKIYTFCPDCGKAFTDYAVDVVMKRLEALYETE